MKSNVSVGWQMSQVRENSCKFSFMRLRIICSGLNNPASVDKIAMRLGVIPDEEDARSIGCRGFFSVDECFLAIIVNGHGNISKASHTEEVCNRHITFIKNVYFNLP